ncbi:MAG: dihydroneopterin aldolase [Verrucomicrobiota bacterium]
MDTIFLRRIRLWGHVGVFEKEKREGQTFLVDIEIDADLGEAGREDNLEKTINYAEVYELARNAMEGVQCDLIEHYAEIVAGEILKRFSMAEEARVSVDKPDAPIEGDFGTAGVTIRRRRDG